MAYGNKTKYVRRYARKGRSKVGKLARGKTTSIQALAKAVRSIQRRDRAQHQYLNYVQGSTQFSITNPWSSVNLCNFSSMTAMFGSAADDETDNKIVHQSFKLDAYVSLENLLNNEEDTINMTAYIVSLRDAIGDGFNPSSGALTLTNQVHYYSQDGLAMLNPKIFKIHRVWRKVLTNHGTALSGPSAQTQSGSDWRFSYKCSPRSMIQNPYGNWKAMASANDPSKQYYLIIFNNNSVVDLESPAVTYNVVHTMKTVV